MLKLQLLALVLCVSTAHGECEEGKWAECRQELVKAIFNSSKVPSRKPDYILVRCSFFSLWLSLSSVVHLRIRCRRIRAHTFGPMSAYLCSMLLIRSPYMRNMFRLTSLSKSMQSMITASLYADDGHISQVGCRLPL